MQSYIWLFSFFSVFFPPLPEQNWSGSLLLLSFHLLWAFFCVWLSRSFIYLFFLIFLSLFFFCNFISCWFVIPSIAEAKVSFLIFLFLCSFPSAYLSSLSRLSSRAKPSQGLLISPSRLHLKWTYIYTTRKIKTSCASLSILQLWMFLNAMGYKVSCTPVYMTLETGSRLSSRFRNFLRSYFRSPKSNCHASRLDSPEAFPCNNVHQIEKLVFF